MSFGPETLTQGSDILKYLVTFASVGGLALKSVARVPKNHRGIRTVRNNPERTWGRKKGRRYGEVGSGFHLVYPFVGDVKFTSMQERPEEVSLDVECEDKKYVCRAALVWHVKRADEADRADPKEGEDFLYNALFKVPDGTLDNRVRALAGAGINLALNQLGREEALQPGVVHKIAAEAYDREFTSYGVALDAINIVSLARSEHQVSADGIVTALQNHPPTPSETLGVALHAVVAND